MFGALFAKECKQILKSMVYYLYVVVFALFVSSQLGGEVTERLAEPVPGQGSYGTTNTHEEPAVMAGVLAGLMLETYHNSYATYPMGFYKGVVLNDAELAEMKDILEDCTGKGWETLVGEMESHFGGYDQSNMAGAMQAQIEYAVLPKESLTYQQFCDNMEKACKLIGAGSSYSQQKIDAGVGVPMTYGQAKAEFDALCEKDRVTGAAARLFCDYAGIILSILPVFLGVTRCLRDKRAQAGQVVCSHPAPTAWIIGSRYLANVCMAFLPVLVIAALIQMPYQYHAKTLGVSPDTFAFLKYGCVWLLPQIMAVLAVSFFITELTENVISIFIQVFWAVASLFSVVSLEGDFQFHLVARWNYLGGTDEFWSQWQAFLLNRGFYFALSILLLLAAFMVYGKKRREGETVYGKIFQRRN